MVFQALAFSAIITLIAACVVRIRIFNAAQYDEIAAPLLDGTFPTTFGDFLWFHLYRRRDRIDQQHRFKIVSYFWLSVSGTVLLLAAGYVHWLTA